jgi:predicted small metal-binding protein
MQPPAANRGAHHDPGARCHDVGHACRFVPRARRWRTFLAQATNHAGEVHGLDVTAELGEAVKQAAREE